MKGFEEVHARLMNDVERTERLNSLMHEIFKLTSELDVSKGDMVSYILWRYRIESLFYSFK